MRITSFDNNLEIMREIGQRARDIRVARNISREDMAQKAGFSVSTIVRFENGGNVNVDVLCNILRVLGCISNTDLLLPSQELAPTEIVKGKTKKMRAAKKQSNKRTTNWKWGDEK